MSTDRDKSEQRALYARRCRVQDIRVVVEQPVKLAAASGRSRLVRVPRREREVDRLLDDNANVLYRQRRAYRGALLGFSRPDRDCGAHHPRRPGPSRARSAQPPLRHAVGDSFMAAMWRSRGLLRRRARASSFPVTTSRSVWSSISGLTSLLAIVRVSRLYLGRRPPHSGRHGPQHRGRAPRRTGPAARHGHVVAKARQIRRVRRDNGNDEQATVDQCGENQRCSDLYERDVVDDRVVRAVTALPTGHRRARRRAVGTGRRADRARAGRAHAGAARLFATLGN